MNPNTNNNGPVVIEHTSPVLEKHVDFILEEEFLCNPAFLPFFIERATHQSEASLPKANISETCKATRSVTDDSGETDVQVIYIDELNRPVAILIEDKVRAGFQPTQQERYRSRGEKGNANKWWADYWICLVAPHGYGSGNHGFDSRVSIEDLGEFFSGNTPRERFRRQVFQEALNHFENTGVQRESPLLTEFRAAYAIAARSFFQNTSIVPQQPRKAWSGDTWFRFTSSDISKGIYITHKAPEGYVDMSFPNTSESVLESIRRQARGTSNISSAKTGKSASLRIVVPRISFPADPASHHESIEQAFRSVLRLHQLWLEELKTMSIYDKFGLQPVAGS